MRISELVERTGIRPLNKVASRDVESVYISDMVSDIITGARANSVLVTLQTHKSLIAAANLVNVSAIVIARNRMPAEDVLDLATRAGIGVFTSELDTWGLAKKMAEIGL